MRFYNECNETAVNFIYKLVLDIAFAIVNFSKDFFNIALFWKMHFYFCLFAFQAVIFGFSGGN